MSVNRDWKQFNDWDCPVCGTCLSPMAISQSEAKVLLDAHDTHKGGGCYKPARRPKTMVPGAEPGCLSSVRKEHLPRRPEKHKAMMARESPSGGQPPAPPAAASALSLYLLYEASRLGVPRRVLARMLANVLLEGAIGAVPIAGDAFDVFFRANRRNIAILRAHFARTGYA